MAWSSAAQVPGAPAGWRWRLARHAQGVCTRTSNTRSTSARPACLPETAEAFARAPDITAGAVGEEEKLKPWGWSPNSPDVLRLWLVVTSYTAPAVGTTVDLSVLPQSASGGTSLSPLTSGAAPESLCLPRCQAGLAPGCTAARRGRGILPWRYRHEGDRNQW